MFKLPVFLDVVAGTGAQRVTTWMKQFGHKMPKCTRPLGTLPTLAELRRPKPQRNGRTSGCSDTGRQRLLRHWALLLLEGWQL
eukprot:11617945-Alexandrium_andersonii.AAC.1